MNVSRDTWTWKVCGIRTKGAGSVRAPFYREMREKLMRRAERPEDVEGACSRA